MGFRNKQVTLIDVAEYCDVSYQTVSRVINNHPSVAPKTRERVQEAIRILNYRPNHAARSLVTLRSNTLGIVSFGTSYYGPGQMVANITRHANDAGYNVTLSMVETLTRDPIQQAIANLQGQLVAGILMIMPVISSELESHVLRELCEGTPFVQIDTKPAVDVASVVIEQFYGARLATQYLIEMGHQQHVEISGPLDWHDALSRHESWLATLKEAGLEPALSLESNWTAEGGYEAALELLNRGLEFTALFAGNDQMALGAIAAFREHGLRVPDDISVIGFDDVPEAAYFYPPLTTIRQDFGALGKQSIEYLVSLIENPDTSVHQRILHPRLIERHSVRRLK